MPNAVELRVESVMFEAVRLRVDKVVGQGSEIEHHYLTPSLQLQSCREHRIAQHSTTSKRMSKLTGLRQVYRLRVCSMRLKREASVSVLLEGVSQE